MSGENISQKKKAEEEEEQEEEEEEEEEDVALDCGIYRPHCAVSLFM